MKHEKSHFGKAHAVFPKRQELIYREHDVAPSYDDGGWGSRDINIHSRSFQLSPRSNYPRPPIKSLFARPRKEREKKEKHPLHHDGDPNIHHAHAHSGLLDRVVDEDIKLAQQPPACFMKALSVVLYTCCGYCNRNNNSTVYIFESHVLET